MLSLAGVPGVAVAAFLLLLGGAAGAAPILVEDDRGAVVSLPGPARRIISLAPHVTELLYAAGAGQWLMGAVAHSDFPPPARHLLRLGAYNRVDIERILLLRPDLVVVWGSGNSADQVALLKTMGLSVFVSEPRDLEDIPRSLETFGRLVGTGAIAGRAATDFRERLQRLRSRYSDRPPLTVFYQVWHQPLHTVGGTHIISRVMNVCGGRNLFADLDGLAPVVDLEAVLSRDPDVIVASGMGESRPEWLDRWRRWEQLSAVRHRHLYFVPPDLLQRHTPRILDGAELLCRQLEQARRNPS